MRSARLPDDLERVRAWLEETRETHITASHESKLWMEWWCLCETYQRLEACANEAPDWQVDHTDLEQGAADFLIMDSTGEFALEITEASVPEDRRAIRLARNTDEVRLLGEPFEHEGKTVPGGRFQGGSKSWDWEEAYVSDIQNAIKRKSGKSYADGARLIVYPNSNATFANPEISFDLLKASIPVHRFSRIDVIWTAGGVVTMSSKEIRYRKPGH